jgi:ABC-type transporter Mla MlaB component
MGWQFEVEHLPERLRKLAGLYGVAELLPAG